MKRCIYLILSVCLMILMIISLPHAHGAISDVEQKQLLDNTDALAYVYNAGNNIVYTMYISTDKIRIVDTHNNTCDDCRFVNRYKENGKIIVNIGYGTLVIDDEKAIFGSAVYILQKKTISE